MIMSKKIIHLDHLFEGILLPIEKNIIVSFQIMGGYKYDDFCDNSIL